MHGDGGRGVHVRVSCWLSAADGASEPCDIGAVGASASCVRCDKCADTRADSCANPCSDRCTDACPYSCSNASADTRANSCTNAGADTRADAGADRGANGCTDRITDTAPLRRRHALLLAQHA